MIRTTLSILVILAATAMAVSAGGESHKRSADGIWQEIDDAALQQRQSQRPIIPQAYRTFSLNLAAIRSLLRTAPMEFTEAARSREVIMTLPMPDGTFARFQIVQSLVIEPGLAANFPGLDQTFSAQGIDDPTMTMRFDLLPTGFHAMVLSTRDTIYVDPYATGYMNNYISYYKQDLRRVGPAFKCDFVNPDGDIEADTSKLPGIPEVTNGQTLRTYRLALAATGEYTVVVGGGTVAGALAAQVLIMNRVNGVYERDVAVHMNIIANNNLIVYTNGVTDPYTNNNPGLLLTENQANCDAVIGTASYDIGHVFSTGGGGLATLNSPCNAGTKARAETGLPSPVGDPFAIDYVAHEIGHQFGGFHTFNGTTGFCLGNRSASAAYEPGSGITIMGYAGICDAEDLALHSIDTFHVKSLEQIVTFITSPGGACGATTGTGSSPPFVAGPGNFTIPKGTPFALTATGSDPNGDTLSFSWEEYDLGAQSPPNSDADGMARPIFRPYLPTAGGTRNFPSLTYILNNANVPPATVGGFLTGEILPSISRTMTFQVVARDNHANGGGINTATSVLTVNGVSGPFVVTAPNTAVSWAGGSAQIVNWNVAGTNGAPVSSANVKISLSTDGGNTFPTTILASTPNDGAQSITVPSVNSSTCRIKVEAVGNIFFDVSDVNFTITSAFVPQKAVLDFDGDGKTDYAVVRNEGGTLNWYIQRSALGFTGSAFGSTGDQLVPGDYDGDLKWDIAVWRAGTFYIFKSTTSTVQITPFGALGDDARVTQDYDGDGKADPAVTRNVGGALTFYILRSALGFTGVTFGNAITDAAIRGDWDGDGKADVAVYRTAAGFAPGTFYVLRSSDGGVSAATFGIFNSDYILPADFDGDGKTDYAVWRGVGPGTTGTWYWLQSSDGGFRALNFGVGGDFGVHDNPVPGDYDGDGKTDQAVWRPAAPSTFYVNRSSLGFVGVGFGISTDTPPAFSLQVR